MPGIRLAVLIDGDNFSADLADVLFGEVGKLGAATIKRVYGNTSSISGWREKAGQHSVVLREMMSGKNAADMAIAIDAMDILNKGKIDGFCLVSSDSDFAPLAVRLHEDGVAVKGFGEKQAAKGFRRACDTFEVLQRPKVGTAVPSQAKSAQQTRPVPTSAVPLAQDDLRKIHEWNRKIHSIANGRSSIPLSELGKHLPKGKRGEGKLKSRLRRLGFTVDQHDMVAVPLDLAA